MKITTPRKLVIIPNKHHNSSAPLWNDWCWSRTWREHCIADRLWFKTHSLDHKWPHPKGFWSRTVRWHDSFPSILHLITISESRLTMDNSDNYKLLGYRDVLNVKTDSQVGGISLFVHERICKVSPRVAVNIWSSDLNHFIVVGILYIATWQLYQYQQYYKTVENTLPLHCLMKHLLDEALKFKLPSQCYHCRICHSSCIWYYFGPGRMWDHYVSFGLIGCIPYRTRALALGMH